MEPNQTGDQNAENCPRCGRPCPKEDRIRGVCPACKKLIASTVELATEDSETEEAQVAVKGQAGGANFDENSLRVSVTEAEDESAETWLGGFCTRHGLDVPTAMVIIGEVERWRLESADDATREAARVALATERDLIERGFIQVQEYEKNNGDRVLAERSMWLLLGFHTLAGTDSLAGLVKLMGPHCKRPSQWSALKARVNKCLQFFQSQVPELPILPGQRDEEAKDKMSKSQVENWANGKAK